FRESLALSLRDALPICFVTYSNQAKVEQLGANTDTLERFGAVSEETAMEMAAGVLAAASASHLAISTTGIAGPGGGTPGTPVGIDRKSTRLNSSHAKIS